MCIIRWPLPVGIFWLLAHCQQRMEKRMILDPTSTACSILGSQYRNLFWNKMVDPIQISPPGLTESSCRCASFGYGLTLRRGSRRELFSTPRRGRFYFRLWNILTFPLIRWSIRGVVRRLGECLGSQGANVINKDQQSPLHRAAFHGHASTALALLSISAQVDICLHEVL